MEITKPDAILFDWDNTLADTWPIIHGALEKTFIAMGREPWSIEDVRNGREGIHNSLRDSFPNIFGEKWEEAKEHYYKNFLDIHLDEITVISGAEEILKKIVENNIYLAVVSNKTGKYLRKEVAHLGWNNFFSKIIGATDANNDKPHPDPVHMALEGSGVELGKNVWFIGDSEKDMECALSSNCTPMFFGNNPFPKKFLLDKRVDSPIIHVKTHGELLSLLDKTL